MTSAKRGTRVIRWTITAVYTVAIFYLAQLVPLMWSTLTDWMGGVENAGNAVDAVVPIVGAAVFILALLRFRETRFTSYCWLAFVFCGFAYILTLHCEYPVERMHLLQYSLLAWLYYRSLKLDFSDRTSYIWTAIAVFLVGLTDELLQGILPERSCTFSDMVTNWCAGSLGMVGFVALQREGVRTWFTKLSRLPKTILGYVLPLIMVAFLSNEIWTRYLYPPLNLVIITVDCARPRNMSCYGYERLTTRYLDEVIGDSAKFTNAYSQAAWTGPGVASTLTGLYPPTHGVTMSGQSVPKSVTTLLDAFRERGYKVPNMSYLTEDANFQNLGAVDDSGIDPTTMDEISALLKWIDNNHRDKFAIWFHYRFVHLPYDPEEEHRVFPPASDPNATPPDEIANVIQKEVIIPNGTVQFSENAKEWIDSLYDGHIRQFDDAFEGLRYRLGLHHITDNTLVVITADHGEELLEHGYVGHASTAVHSKHYDELLNIPLIMICPRMIPNGVELDVPAQQVDIMPTVMDIMGWPTPDDVQGRSLYPAILGEQMDDVPQFAESVEGGYQAKEDMRSTFVRSVRTRDWKLIVRTSPQGEDFELYDLANDPGEKDNIFGKNAAAAGDLFAKLADWMTKTGEAREEIMKREAELAASNPGTGSGPRELEIPTVTEPVNGATIDYDSSGGALTMKWTGNPEAHYLIEYHVGEGWHTLKGKLDVTGTQKVFGPLPKDAWKPLYQWNPYRLRVRPKGLPDGWSEWTTISVAPLE